MGIEPATYRPLCAKAVCGDGLLVLGEECDDGNVAGRPRNQGHQIPYCKSQKGFVQSPHTKGSTRHVWVDFMESIFPGSETNATVIRLLRHMDVRPSLPQCKAQLTICQ